MSVAFSDLMFYSMRTQYICQQSWPTLATFFPSPKILVKFSQNNGKSSKKEEVERREGEEEETVFHVRMA